jgi:hypothetical protein
MKRMMLMSSAVVAAGLLAGCGDSSQKPASEGGGGSPAANAAKSGAPAAAVTKVAKNINDLGVLWNDLYKQNEKVITNYDGMPIMELVTPAIAFMNGAFYDMLNIDNKEGRFDGTIPMSGVKGFVEKKGAKITFGSDHTLEKDGFGAAAKKGDRVVEAGSVDLEKKMYVMETYTERGGNKIARNFCEFKGQSDGSMISITQDGHALTARGETELGDSVIYLHNGKGQYDFVVASAKTGPGFKSLSFAEKGDLTKEKAMELFKESGYKIDKSGGIKGGKLVVDK